MAIRSNPRTRGDKRTYGLFSRGRSRFYGYLVSLNHDLPVDWHAIHRLHLKVLMNYTEDITLRSVIPRHPFEELENE